MVVQNFPLLGSSFMSSRSALCFHYPSRVTQEVDFMALQIVDFMAFIYENGFLIQERNVMKFFKNKNHVKQ